MRIIADYKYVKNMYIRDRWSKSMDFYIFIFFRGFVSFLEGRKVYNMQIVKKETSY